MEDFERHLQESLRRKDPPPYLEARILAAAKDERGAPRPWFWQRTRWAVALGAVVLTVGGVAWQQERAAQERAAGQAAKQRLQLALKITSVKLQQIQREVMTSND